MNLFAWFKPAPPIPRLPQPEVDRLYPRYRWRIFESAFLAYAMFYIVRNNFAPVSKEMGAALHYDKSMIGTILLATSAAYGIGKLVMGYFADRSDARKYVATGMLLTAGLNFIFGATRQYWAHVFLWTINGFVQGMGYGPCTRGLSHWYSEKERGTIFGIWNTSHNIGGGIAGWLAALCADRWGWPSAFYVPGIIATVGAVYLFWRVRDTPQSQGLPPVEEYKRDYPPEERESHERELSAREMFFTYILPNKLLWVLAIANIFVYIARYAMVDWGPTYLKEVKGASLTEGGFSTLVIEFAGAAGMLSMGWVSDKLGGRRARVSVMAMIPLVLAFGGLIFTGSVLLVQRDIKNSATLVEKLRTGADPVSRDLWARIPETARARLGQDLANSGQQRAKLTEELNAIVKGTNTFYEAQRFANVAFSDETRTLLAKSPKKGELVYLHRLLLEDTYPAEIAPHRFSLKGLLWINMVIFAVIGFLVYVPVMFSGVMSLDLTTKKAVGTAAGFVGMFGYVGGRMMQGKGLGWVAQHYGWDAGIYMVMGCTILGIILLSFLWNVRPRG